MDKRRSNYSQQPQHNTVYAKGKSSADPVSGAMAARSPYDMSGSTVLLVHPRAIFSILAENRDNTAADRSSAYRTRKSAEVSQKFTKFCELSRVWHVYAIYVFTPKSARICDTFRIS